MLRRLPLHSGTVICYYPSDEYIDCLNDMEKIDGIDCNDLFTRKNPRERIIIYRFNGKRDDSIVK